MNELIMYVALEIWKVCFESKMQVQKIWILCKIFWHIIVCILYRKCLFKIRIQKYALEEFLLYSGC